MANVNDSLGLFLQASSQAIEFNDQNSPGVERKTKMISGLDGLRDELIHHLHRAGNDARSDDIADGLAGVLDVFENTEHGLVSLRGFDELNQHAGDDAEHSLTTNHPAAQVIAIWLFAAARFGAEPDDLAVGQHHLKTEHVIGGDTVLKRVRSAGVHGHITADRTGRLAGGVRREKKSAPLHRIGYPGINATGFDERAAVAKINLEDFVHAPQRNHHPAGNGED